MNQVINGAKRAVLFCFDGTEYGVALRKEIENLGYSLMMYYEHAKSEIIVNIIAQLRPADDLDVSFVIVYHKSLGKEIRNLKKECRGKKVVFVSTNQSI